MAFQRTGAAFSATTDNTGNAFVAGTVTLTDNDSGTAMFNVPNMTLNDSAVGCIEVTYSGTLDPLVKTYGASTAGDGLEDYLDLTIEGGPDGTVPYRFTMALQDNTLAQAKTVTVTFTWEAQNL